ncbi:hypothetical protein MBLNU13_g08281t1 [Cladosporium sp. NU13]
MSNSQDNVNKRQNEGDGDEQQVKRTRFDYDYDYLIKVIAGTPESDTQQFRVHKDRICETSNFFKAAVTTERWLEGRTKVVKLPDFTPRAVQAYIHWVYSDKVLPEVFWQTAEVSGFNEQLAYIKLYLLAEYLDDTPLRVEILDAMISKIPDWDNVPGYDVCQRVWERTPTGSPLRSVMLEWKIRYQSPESFAENVEKVPREFLEEMTVLYMKRPALPSDRETLGELSARLKAQLLSLPVKYRPQPQS